MKSGNLRPALFCACMKDFLLNIFAGLERFQLEHPFLVLGVVAILLALLLIMVIPPLLGWSRLLRRARRDYRLARGTHHLNQIIQSLNKIDAELVTLETTLKKIRKDINNLEVQRQRKLRAAATRHIVETRLIEADGIGPAIRDRIIDECFDGTLQSLKKAQRVYGVGEEKYWAILMWVDKMDVEVERLLSSQFPNKAEISQECNRQKSQLTQRLSRIEDRIEFLSQTRKKASDVRNRLGEVKLSHFRKSYGGDVKASEVVNEYIKGAFAEWQPVPLWYKDLISEFGD